jgi:hypothetical protein
MASAMSSSANASAQPGHSDLAATDDCSPHLIQDLKDNVAPGELVQSTNEHHGYKGHRGRWRQKLANLFHVQQAPIVAAVPARPSMGSSALTTVRDTPLPGGWDEGVFDSELLKSSIVPRNITAAHTGRLITPPKAAGKPNPVQEGTYHGTKLALTQMMARIERR